MVIVIEEVIFPLKSLKGKENQLKLIMKKIKGEMVKSPQI